MDIETKNRIIFTDPGKDDFAALRYLACNNMFPPTHTVLVPTFGNVPEKQAYRNLLQIHSVLNLNPNFWSIARGPTKPLDSKYSPIAHKAVYGGNGNNGLWNVSSSNEGEIDAGKPKVIPLNEIELRHISEIVSLGPLTGPIALQRNGVNPEKILIMGGAFEGGNVRQLDKSGNYLDPVGRVAEWNIFKDPRAAQEQFTTHAGQHIFLVTKDACMGALVTAKSIIEGSYDQSTDINFMRQVLQGWAIEYAKVNPAVVSRGLMLADLIAVIGYYHPDLLIWEKTGIEVVDELGPDLGRTYKNSSNPACNVAVAVNRDEIDTLMEAVNTTIFGMGHKPLS
jgi:inosine-uridine nucleoside N-ribohydrolase